jgi:hypothetical protein
MIGWFNNLPESNRRPASPLSAGEVQRAVHAQDFVPGGGRSANRWGT